jgi:predicted O-methyltransferase YrrM
MNPGELEILCALLDSVHPHTVIEFGVNVGRTAQAILEYVPGIKHYVGIDVPLGYVPAKVVQRNEVPEQAGELVRDDVRFRLLLPEGGSQNLEVADLPPCDAAFIDGDHSRDGVMNDTVLSLQRVRAGGIIVWHDYHDLGTVDVADYLHEKAASGWDLHHVEGTWLVYMRV